MYDNNKFCERIKKIYPDIGKCGVNVRVKYDEVEKVWIVDLKKGALDLRTHLEPEEAERCMEGKQCVSLGLQVAELRAYVESMANKTS